MTDEPNPDDPIPLTLPSGSKVVFHSLSDNTPVNFRSEDETYIHLPGGVSLDCGWYGRNDEICRVVAFRDDFHAGRLETVEATTAADAAREIERMAAKYVVPGGEVDES